MHSKKKEPIPDFHEVKVRLKPFLGIKPTTYVPVIYAILIILILFFLLFFPGLRTGGEYVSFSSHPSGAFVTIDGKYRGSTPFVTLVKNGKHRITISKPFFKTYVEDFTVKGRIFATLIFPSKIEKYIPLKLEDRKALLDSASKDFAENPHIPEIIEDTANSTFSLNRQEGSEALEEYFDFLKNSAFFVQNERQLKYLLKGFFLVSSRGCFMNLQTFVLAIQKMAVMSKEMKRFPIWIALSLREKNSKVITDSSWFRNVLKGYIEDISDKSRIGITPSKASFLHVSNRKTISVAGINFSLVPAGRYLMGNDTDMERLSRQLDYLFPVESSTDSFYMSTTEVTNGSFYQFIKSNPFWAPKNREELISRGLVTKDYLKDFQNGRPKREDFDFPVRYVSYYAARAYAKWFSGKLKGLLPQYAAQLPKEYQWEWAARGGVFGTPYPATNLGVTEVTGEKGEIQPGELPPEGSVFYRKGIKGPLKAGSSVANGFGLRDMSGNLWEWNDTWFSPASYLIDYSGPRVGAEKVVRGGSWANKKELVPLYIRGSQPPSWCTAYTGFRIILTRISENK